VLKRCAIIVVWLCLTDWEFAVGETLSGRRAIVIAHRGASGYRPEHTIEAYKLAIEQGADFLEPDLVLTADGVLICRHDNLLDLSTNVAEVAKADPTIARLRTTKSVDGEEMTGWFAEDFTMTQIGRLRAMERRVGDPPRPFRPANAAFDGQLGIPTFTEVIRLARAHGVGIYPETKHPTHIERETQINMSEVLLEALVAEGVKRAGDLPVFIQSFEVNNLRFLRREMQKRGMEFPLVQLLDAQGQPYDVRAAGGGLTYDEMATPAGLATIAEYAAAVGPEKHHFILPLDGEGRLDAARATTFVADAHAAGLAVHPYTFRAENRSLPANLRVGDASHEGFDTSLGEAAGEIQAFLELGIDGFFTDHPDVGRAAVASGAVGDCAETVPNLEAGAAKRRKSD
jgi:glycerophosphoryl diester phosphodiesterase